MGRRAVFLGVDEGQAQVAEGRVQGVWRGSGPFVEFPCAWQGMLPGAGELGPVDDDGLGGERAPASVVPLTAAPGLGEPRYLSC